MGRWGDGGRTSAATLPTTQHSALSTQHSPSTQHSALGTQHSSHTQAESTEIPACKSCHAVAAADQKPDIRQPNLKGAYHRQCLNCHREWTHANACVACHKPRHAGAVATTAPTADDIVGRMHPPIPEPDVKVYQARFTPAAGGNVMFRHKEHTEKFGIRCAACHRRDNCSHCHDPKADNAAMKPMQPARTWQASHEPCVGCHKLDRCAHCHYPDGQSPPAAFNHAMTGQTLDKDHAKLACGDCHADLKRTAKPTCGDSRCHEPHERISFPRKRPGKVVATQPATRPATTPVQTTQPSDRPIILRVRR